MGILRRRVTSGVCYSVLAAGRSIGWWELGVGRSVALFPDCCGKMKRRALEERALCDKATLRRFYCHHRLHCSRYRRQLPSPLSPRASLFLQARRRRSQRPRFHWTCSNPVPNLSTPPALNGAADVGRAARPRPAASDRPTRTFLIRSSFICICRLCVDERLAARPGLLETLRAQTPQCLD
jgi:hypothetical protein